MRDFMGKTRQSSGSTNQRGGIEWRCHAALEAPPPHRTRTYMSASVTDRFKSKDSQKPKISRRSALGLRKMTYASPSVLPEGGAPRVSEHAFTANWYLKLALRETHILCTKSPKRLRYAESFDGPGDFGFDSGGASASSLRTSSFLSRSASLDVEASTAVVSALVILWSVLWACECECPESSSPPLRTRSVFSMKKNAANPTKIPSLSSMGVETRDRSLSSHSEQGNTVERTLSGCSVSLQPSQNGHQDLDVHPWMSVVRDVKKHQKVGHLSVADNVNNSWKSC